MTIGLFAPLPLAIMIPFMAAQSFAMGEAFGKSFQYGKRKISSMTNEQFNKLTAEALHAEVQNDISKMIPHMKNSFDRMEKFQSEVVNSIIRGIAETIGNLGGALTDTGGTTDVAYSGSLGIPYGALQATDPVTAAINAFEAAQKFLKEQGIIIGDLVSPETLKNLTKKKTEPKKHVHTSQHHFIKTTEKVIDTKQIVGQSNERKLAAQNNVKAWGQKLAQALNLLKRVKNIRVDKGNSIRDLRARAAYTKRQGQAKANEIRRVTSLILDYRKKVQNSKTILKNFR